MLMYLSMDKTTSRLEDRMNPPVLTIIRALHIRLPAYHWVEGSNTLLISGNHLNSGSPGRLHGEGDEAGDGVRYGQVEDKVVHIGTASVIRFRKLYLQRFAKKELH